MFMATGEKYKTSTLTEHEKALCLKKLKNVMIREKAYLIPAITINHLADKLSISSRYLSQIINQCLQMNFYDFINGYRIEEAKKYLTDPSNDRKNILEILYEVGFNSKTAFNVAFKINMGISPTHFKKLQTSV